MPSLHSESLPFDNFVDKSADVHVHCYEIVLTRYSGWSINIKFLFRYDSIANQPIK